MMVLFGPVSEMYFHYVIDNTHLPAKRWIGEKLAKWGFDTPQLSIIQLHYRVHSAVMCLLNRYSLFENEDEDILIHALFASEICLDNRIKLSSVTAPKRMCWNNDKHRRKSNNASERAFGTAHIRPKMRKVLDHSRRDVASPQHLKARSSSVITKVQKAVSTFWKPPYRVICALLTEECTSHVLRSPYS